MRYRDQRRHIIAYLRAGDEVPQSAYFAPDSKQRKYFTHYLESKLPSSLLEHQRLYNGAKVTRDRFGIPHIFAENENDLWFACGYVQAQDRLWQLDYRHRVATGRLAEAIGDEGLHGDIESRTIGFERAARLELAKVDERSAAVLESFSRGSMPGSTRQSTNFRSSSMYWTTNRYSGRQLPVSLFYGNSGGR